MSDKNILFKRDYYPINSLGIVLQSIKDPTHTTYSLLFGGIEALLFDNMHVDAMFHDEKDPLHQYYPSVENIVSDLTDARLLKNLETATIYLEKINNEFYGTMLNGFKEYVKNSKVMPLEISRKFFGEFVKTIKKNTFQDQLNYIKIAKNAVEKQIKFLSEIAQKDEKLKLTISVYEKLQQILSDTVNSHEKVIEGYNKVTQQLYQGQEPPKIFGEQPTYTKKEEPIDALMSNMFFMSRPAIAVLLKKEVRRRIEECIDGIGEIADKLQLEVSKQGHYSTRPDLR